MPRDHKPVDYSSTKRRGQPPSEPKTKVTTDPSVIEDLEPDNFDQVRMDYNNPAKSMEQNKAHQFEGRPWIGKPSKVDFDNYQWLFVGAPMNVIQIREHYATGPDGCGKGA